MAVVKLLSKRAVSESLFELSFEKPAQYSFKCGQFARLGLTVEAEKVFRAYSIASHPSEDKITFIIRRVEDGLLSPRLCSLNEGDCAELDENAEGNLLPSRIPGGKTLWLMCTGSGVSPYLSMLKDPEIWKSWSDIVLVNGCRYIQDGVPATEAVNMDLPGALTVVVAATREEPIEDCHISGRITDLLASGMLEDHVGKKLDPEDSRVMLCGNPAFIDEMRAILKTRGFTSPRFGKPGNLLAETFW